MRGILILLAIVTAAAQDRTISSDADVRSVVFSKDGNTVFAVCGDRKLRAWDVRTGTLRKTTEWREDQRPAGMAAMSGLWALAGNDGNIAVSEFDGGAAIARIAIGDRRVGQLAIAPDGKSAAGSSRVAGNSREEMMRLWDGSGKERFEVPSGIGGTSAMAISPDGAVLAAGSWDTNLRVWNTRNGELVKLIADDLPVAMFGLAFTPDGKNLAAAGVDRTVYFWDTKTWKLERKLTGQPEMISAMAFSADGRRLATGGFNDITQKHPVSVLLWDVATGKVLRTMPAPQRVSSVALSPDGKLVASTSGGKTVNVWAAK